MISPDSESDPWKPGLYDEKHSFVWKLGSSVVELLAPQPGQRILDVGCGTGQLTAQIVETGAKVVGLDNSPAMIEEARRLFPQIEFREADAHDFDVPEPFDAVFSNAALHWIKDPDRVMASIARALKSQGRVAVEFGGRGNVRFVVEALEKATRTILGEAVAHPWYFPTIAEFAALLERHQLEATYAALIDRPTPLEGEEGLRNWVRMFGPHWLSRVPPERHEEFFRSVEAHARLMLYRDEVWHADYRRIRVLAQKT